ncbi:MAG: DNA repair protein RecN [Clostridia bacterium]|nr:DNA repair protein RecN [Clostridia bacterium]
MLSSLSIKNIALIDDLKIELGNGLNVLTGETGAGKSLVIDSISLLLGERADKSLISFGKEYAYVEAVFDDVNECVCNLLEDFGLERESTVVISRKITMEGKNECRVNGKVFTLSMLKKISTPLMDLHGQFEHQLLLAESNHIKMLDYFAGNKVSSILHEFKSAHAALKDILNQISSFETDSSERARLLDLYKFQIDEIENAGFKDGEEEELKDFRVRVLSQEKILESIKSALLVAEGGGYGGSSIVSMIGKMSSDVSGAAAYVKEAQSLSSRIDGVKFEIMDIIDSLESIKDNLYFNEFEAEENEKRLDLLSSLKKKYGSTVQEINKYLDKIRFEFKRLEDSEDLVRDLEIQKETLASHLLKIGTELSTERKKAALKFEERMTAELVSLGMKDAKFVVKFSDVELESAQSDGLDKVEFLFTANAGQPLKLLSSVASGGEISRLMLAIKNIGGGEIGASTMIFDEIDTGVSGHIAAVIAEKLLSIAKTHQVICVTHLAQIASYGTDHYYIEKNTTDGTTKTSIQKINGESRIREIARLIGGNISEFSLEHAKAMIEDGINFRKK